ncbi:hypothetical protein GGF32_002581 [Allomyces javanicus]|nr:hypothetical protein GGF32_002581 [Allomyces javanicus]
MTAPAPPAPAPAPSKPAVDSGDLEEGELSDSGSPVIATRMQRGEPVSDSEEDEDEEDDEDGEVDEDDAVADQDDDAALPTTDETEGQLDLDGDDDADAGASPEAVTAAVPQVVADAAHLSDTDVMLHLQHAWYCAGYYAGILEQRRVANGGAPPQDGDQV